MTNFAAGVRKRWAWVAGLAAVVGLLGAQTVRVGASNAADEADAGMESIRPEAIRADMRFLADDLLEGRGTGTRGHEIAAKFVAAEFDGMGLEPAGEHGTYFQSVPLRWARTDEAKTSLTLVRGGKEEKLVFRKEFIAFGDPSRTEVSAEAPVVYVGFGVTAKEQGYDDYQGVDVKGKVVAQISGAPASFETSLRAHYSAGELKAANAAAHGAAGVLVLDDPLLEKLYSFKEQVRDLAFPQLRWLDAQGRPNDYYPEVAANAFLNMEATKKFFEGSGHTAEEVYAAENASKPMSFATGVTAKIHNVTKLHDIHSPNVVGKLTGSDPRLREEYVVYTAHLDHLGIGEPVKGDKIYNGALDNGSGSAEVLEIARAFTRLPTRPRRSILFVAVTGEEAGLLGSDYFAQYPTAAKKSIVANINIDEDLMLWPLKDVIVYGAEHSSLGDVVNEAAKRLHLEVSLDTQPEEVFFIRSDQYSFVKQGVPAIAASAGTKSDDPKINAKEIAKKWEENIYHNPQDDMSQPFDFDAGVKYTRFSFLCGYLVAQKSERPRWNGGDFFGEHYGRKSE